MQRAIELDPNRAAFHEDLAILQSADPTKAASVEDELKKAVALDPKSVNAKLLLAAFYAKTNRLADAEKVSWDAVATDPKSLAARANVAGIILKEGDQAESRGSASTGGEGLSPTIRRESASWQTTTRAPDSWTRPRQSTQALPRSIRRTFHVQKGYIRVLLEAKDYGPHKPWLPDC